MSDVYAHVGNKNEVIMQSRIFEITGVLSRRHSIIVDADRLWARFHCDDAAQNAGLQIIHIQDEMNMRFQYEKALIANETDALTFVIDTPSVYIPLDIAQDFYVQTLTYHTVFPTLSAEALRAVPGIDFDWLVACLDKLPFGSFDIQQTIAWCREGMYQPDICRDYAITLLEKARALAENASDHRDWGTIADYYGKAAMAQHSGTYLPNWAEARADIERFFATWVAQKYNMLSGSIDRKRPVLLSKVADFVRRSGKRIAIIVMDGMSFENFYTIQREIVESNLAFEVESSFSFFPTVTCVARQSIFSGKLPSEHAKPFSLENEEKQWRTFWKNTGLHEQEIYFSKGIPGSIPSEAKAVGIVINIVDDLMHSELQGYKGIQQGLCEWTKSGQLAQILKRLISDGYGVFMTSDHGNTAAIAEGRFAKPGVLAESASRRAVIYNASFDARELDKFNVMRYSGTYLPDGYTAYLFNADSCYGDTGKEYITHGGMTLEETVVPFVQVGAYNG